MRCAPLTDEDLDAVADLWTRGWVDGHLGHVPDALVKLRNFESFRSRLQDHKAHTQVAFQDGAVAGFFILDANELDQFYVAAEARGTGLAAQLMQAAQAALLAAGHTSAWLACTVGNDRAARFYTKMGWHNRGVERFEAFTENGPFALDVWRFEKAL